MLECLVCLEYPRSRPIYTCSNGHVTCAGCQAKLVVAWKKGTCPKCEDRHIKQDPFVQRLADKTLQGIPTPCQFAQFGCPVKQDIAAIGGHEEQCQYREVHCPAKHRGACQWFGALPKMVAHVREKGCIQASRFTNMMAVMWLITVRIFQKLYTLMLNSLLDHSHRRAIFAVQELHWRLQRPKHDCI